MELDKIDMQIITLLQKNARISIVELAARVHLSPTPAKQRIRRLEAEGVISGYHALINPQALNQSLMVFVTVTLKATDEASLKAFHDGVMPVRQILECHMLGGGFDYLLKLRVADMPEYREILGRIIGALPMVENTHSYFVMEQVKESPLLPIPESKGRKS